MNQRDASSNLVVQPKKTYKEFREVWLASVMYEPTYYFPELVEYFCECDYKRYTGEWNNTL